MRNLTDKVPIPCRMLWKPAPSGECRLNLLYREEEREMLPLCGAEGIGALAAFGALPERRPLLYAGDLAPGEMRREAARLPPRRRG